MLVSRLDFPVRLTIIGMRRWTSTVTISVILKPRSMAMWRVFELSNWNFQETRLVTPTSSTIPIVQAAHDVLDRIFIQGYQYKKAGVIVMGISPDSPIQQDLFDLNAEQIQKMRRLDEVIDRINRMHGSETIVIGAQQYTQKNGKGKAEVFANAIKHDFRSKNPTTRWADIIKLR